MNKKVMDCNNTLTNYGGNDRILHCNIKETYILLLKGVYGWNILPVTLAYQIIDWSYQWRGSLFVKYLHDVCLFATCYRFITRQQKAKN